MENSLKEIELIKFNQTDFVDRELVDKVSIWMLRVLLKCGGFVEVKENNLYNYVVEFLGITKSQIDKSEITEKEQIFILLSNKLEKLEMKKNITTSKVLSKNIKKFSKLMDLNRCEEEVLEFLIILNQFDILLTTTCLLGNNLNSSQIKNLVSKILNISNKEINNIFSYKSKFNRSMLLTINKKFSCSIYAKFEFISNEFSDNMMNLDEDISVIIQDSVRECTNGTLHVKDFEHINEDIEILISHIKNALLSKQSGVNILLYGLPGTGKTELVKSISKELKIKLYEISYASSNDEPIDGKDRLRAYKTAQYLLNKSNMLLMYDEAEDIFEIKKEEGGITTQRQKDKAWLNRILETNSVPTIWITNNINSIDNAIVRRFDMAIEIPIPNRAKREEILKKYTNNILDEKTIKTLSYNKDIAPALVSRASKVIDNITHETKNEAFKKIVNNTLMAQGYNEMKDVDLFKNLPNNYNTDFINSSTNLEELTSGIKQCSNARLCLYGPAGTGKSAFGLHIAKSLDKDVILKKVSELQSKWVGESEKNIADAFKEAKKEGAVLIFDEVDSFLQDRTNANNSWEVSLVNEMLVQMENFDGIFIATTNLMDNLDRASLRRFDLKLEFSYLLKKQAWDMFISYCEVLDLNKPSLLFKKVIENLVYLTPGDFTAVVRQNRFRPIKNIKDFIDRLKDEVKIKNVQDSNKMGFMG